MPWEVWILPSSFCVRSGYLLSKFIYSVLGQLIRRPGFKSLPHYLLAVTLDKHLTSLSFSYFNIKRLPTHRVVLTILFTIPCRCLWSLAQLLPLHGPVSYDLLFTKFKAHCHLTLVPRTPAHGHLFLLWTCIADVFICIQQRQSGKVTERPWLCSQTDLAPLFS